MLSSALYCDRQGELMEMVKEEDFDLNAKDRESSNSLIYATMFNQRSNGMECLKVLVNTPSVDLDARNGRQWTALMRGADASSIDCVQLLLQAGADVNTTGIYGDTALSLSGTLECTKLLAHWPSTTHFSLPMHSLKDDYKWVVDLITSRLNDNRFEILNLIGQLPREFHKTIGGAIRQTTRLLELDLCRGQYHLIKGNYSVIEVGKWAPEWARQQAKRNAFALDRCKFTSNWNTLRQRLKGMIGRDVAGLLMDAVWETRGDEAWTVVEKTLN
jgi:hypothetical protein